MVMGLGLIVAGAPVWGDGFRNPSEGMTALGKIGGKIVYHDDASTVTHNPANLVDITNRQLSASFTVGYGKKEFEPDTGGKASSTDNTAVLPNFFAAWPLESGDWVVGVGLTTPYGRSTTFSKNSVLRYTTPYFTELYAVNMNPTIAYKVDEAFSVAVGINFLYSELDIRQIYPWSLATGDPAAADGETQFEADGGGVGFNAAVTWNITERQRAAVTYRSKVKVEYEGDLRLTGVPSPAGLPAPLAFVTSRSDFETEIEFPAVLAVGYGMRVTDKLRVEANVEWVQHSLFEELSLDAGANTALLPSSSIPADWDDNWTYGIGADYQLNEQWVLRGGALYLETPIPGQTMLPSIAEEDQVVLSIGCGYAAGKHRIDAAYSYGVFNGRTVDNNVNPAFNGDYDFEAHLLGASYTLVF
jgi:long-chain fatty acid transport protein